MSLFTTSHSLLNQFGESITIFSVEEGADINDGDLVVVNSRTLLASRPKKESGYISVGRAVEVIVTEHGTKRVICKDGIYELRNSKNWEHKVSGYSEGGICYFEDDNTVSLDNINTTKAGEVIHASKKKVLIKIDANREVQSW